VAYTTKQCQDVVCVASLAKFEQVPKAKEYLLSTMGKFLACVEPCDTYWSIGFAQDCSTVTIPPPLSPLPVPRDGEEVVWSNSQKVSEYSRLLSGNHFLPVLTQSNTNHELHEIATLAIVAKNYP
jgi:hypothetical protein